MQDPKKPKGRDDIFVPYGTPEIDLLMFEIEEEDYEVLRDLAVSLDVEVGQGNDEE